jgi:hypothetical protein
MKRLRSTEDGDRNGVVTGTVADAPTDSIVAVATAAAAAAGHGNTSSFLGRLPTAIVALVCSHLTVPEHAAVSRVDRHLRRVTQLPSASPQSVSALELWEGMCDAAGNDFCRDDKRLFVSVTRKTPTEIAVPDAMPDTDISDKSGGGGQRSSPAGGGDDDDRRISKLVLAAVNSRLIAAALRTRPRRLAWDSDDISWMSPTSRSTAATTAAATAADPGVADLKLVASTVAAAPMPTLGFGASLRHLVLGAPSGARRAQPPRDIREPGHLHRAGHVAGSLPVADARRTAHPRPVAAVPHGRVRARTGLATASVSGRGVRL